MLEGGDRKHAGAPQPVPATAEPLGLGTLAGAAQWACTGHCQCRSRPGPANEAVGGLDHQCLRKWGGLSAGENAASYCASYTSRVVEEDWSQPAGHHTIACCAARPHHRPARLRLPKGTVGRDYILLQLRVGDRGPFDFMVDTGLTGAQRHWRRAAHLLVAGSSPYLCPSARPRCAALSASVHHHYIAAAAPCSPSLPFLPAPAAELITPHLRQVLGLPPARQRIDQGLGAGGVIQADLVQVEGGRASFDAAAAVPLTVGKQAQWGPAQVLQPCL